jgi:hypothetical protein
MNNPRENGRFTTSSAGGVVAGSAQRRVNRGEEIDVAYRER